MRKLWAKIVEKACYVSLIGKMTKSIKIAALIEEIPLTEKQCQALAIHVLADIHNGRV